MENLLVVRSKIKDFLEYGSCEAHSLEHAKLIISILSEECNEFGMKYKNSSLGEYWYFSKS